MTDPGRDGTPAGEPSTGEAPPAGGADKARSAHLPLWQEMGLLLVVALLLAVVIKALLMQAFYIPSGSMNDTLVFNDRILVQKVSYWGGGEPRRGDIVVFSDPGGWLDDGSGPQPSNPITKGLELVGLFPTGGHLVKRVIAVGGDTVKCCDKANRLLVNGEPLRERPYLAPGARPSLTTFEQEIPEGYLWVMGDNRPESADSRVHLGDPGGGCVPVDDVVGKVFAVVWPLSHMKVIERPETFEDVPPAPGDAPDMCGG